jgi:hypothetical protein
VRATTSTPVERPSRPTWQYLGALAAVSLVVRLPQLLSPNLLLEGDECVLGLMGMHLARRREFPIFFYGQTYGLSVVEAPAAALSFAIAGVGPVPPQGRDARGLDCRYVLLRPCVRTSAGQCAQLLDRVVARIDASMAAASMKAWSDYLTACAVTGALL